MDLKDQSIKSNFILKEAVAQKCSVKNVFLEISQNSQENTCAKDSFLIKLQAAPATLLKKRFWHRCFPVNFAKFLITLFSQNTSGGYFCINHASHHNHIYILFLFLFLFFLILEASIKRTQVFIWNRNYLSRLTKLPTKSKTESYIEQKSSKIKSVK